MGGDLETPPAPFPFLTQGVTTGGNFASSQSSPTSSPASPTSLEVKGQRLRRPAGEQPEQGGAEVGAEADVEGAEGARCGPHAAESAVSAEPRGT